MQTPRVAAALPIPQLRSLTERNNHTEAYILAAKALGLAPLAKKFELIEGLINLEGHLPHDLRDYQYRLYKELMKFAEHRLSPEEYHEFYHSF